MNLSSHESKKQGIVDVDEVFEEIVNKILSSNERIKASIYDLVKEVCKEKYGIDDLSPDDDEMWDIGDRLRKEAKTRGYTMRLAPNPYDGPREGFPAIFDYYFTPKKENTPSVKNLIQEEFELSESKMLKEVDYKGAKLVALTKDNVATVEAMIRNDSDYLKVFDKNARPIENRNLEVKYPGSSTYWIMELKKVLIDKDKSVYDYDRIIKEIVEAVDRENSTHLNADGVGREEITNRIKNIPPDKLLKCLKNPEYDDMFLIREISRLTSAEKRARKNISFASKFCHYTCFNLYEGTEYQDNYSIYDSIIKSVLPFYLDHYEIKEEYDLNNYRQYSKAIDAIRDKAEEKISRNGFDHLLWYYHKGRMDQLWVVVY